MSPLRITLSRLTRSAKVANRGLDRSAIVNMASRRSSLVRWSLPWAATAKNACHSSAVIRPLPSESIMSNRRLPWRCHLIPGRPLRPVEVGRVDHAVAVAVQPLPGRGGSRELGAVDRPVVVGVEPRRQPPPRVPEVAGMVPAAGLTGRDAGRSRSCSGSARTARACGRRGSPVRSPAETRFGSIGLSRGCCGAGFGSSAAGAETPQDSASRTAIAAVLFREFIAWPPDGQICDQWNIKRVTVSTGLVLTRYSTNSFVCLPLGCGQPEHDFGRTAGLPWARPDPCNSNFVSLSPISHFGSETLIDGLAFSIAVDGLSLLPG